MIPESELRLLRKLGPPSLELGYGLGMPPAGRGHVDLNFASALSPMGFALTRASTGTYGDSAGLVATAAIDAARYDYSLTSIGTLLGLLYEPARTNIILRSSDFSNATWGKVTAPVTTNAGTNPDGSSTVQTVTASGANAFLYQASVLGNGVAGFSSVWIRRRTGSGTIRLRSAPSGTDTAITVTADWARVSMPIMGNGAQDCWVLNIATSGDAIDLWGADLKAGALSSHIPTVASQVTRSADVGTLHIPVGISSLRYTFDDDSTQDVAVTAGAYTIPTTLNRSRIKRIVSL